METSKQLTDKLHLMGCAVRFKPYWDSETESVLLAVRHPVNITNGVLIGAMIDVYDRLTFRVWTSHKKKANSYAKRHKLTIRNLDGECELFVPAHLADEILPKLGAKVTRTVSEATKAKLKATWFTKYRDNTRPIMGL